MPDLQAEEARTPSGSHGRSSLPPRPLQPRARLGQPDVISLPRVALRCIALPSAAYSARIALSSGRQQ
jgi:hypothetical protein